MSASVCCAIINSSSVGMTQTETPLSALEMRDPPDVFAGSSSFTPKEPSLPHNAARSGAEFSPPPPADPRCPAAPACHH